MSTTSASVPAQVVERVVGLAARAPSVHNSQPWRWRWDGTRLELWADRGRQLPTTDPDGRNLHLSCGAALHHTLVAARAVGCRVHTERLPDPDRPDLLARMELGPGVPGADSAELVRAIEERCTDRRRFTSWPVPDGRLTHLAAEAQSVGARALPVTDVSARFHAEVLINRALDLQDRDAGQRHEQESWVGHGPTDGMPLGVLPRRHHLASRRVSRFAGGLLDDDGRDIEGADGLVVLYGADDSPEHWLTAGEGLSALWLAATVDGLSVVPLSQAVEVEETRTGLRLEVLGGLAHPLLLVRVGWQTISRSELPRTPRRPVSELLDLA